MANLTKSKESYPCKQPEQCLPLFTIVQNGRKLNLEIDLMLKLLDTCVLPILMYGSEIWGYESIDILEKVYTKFCKIILSTSKYVHNS
jgi:hypothetical protein